MRVESKSDVEVPNVKRKTIAIGCDLQRNLSTMSVKFALSAYSLIFFLITLFK